MLPAPPRLTDRERAATLFDRATAARNGGRPAVARRLYGELQTSLPHSPESKLAIVLVAQLDFDGGAFETALRGFERYLASGHGALRQDAEGPHVLVIADAMAQRRAVEIGRSWDGGALLEVESGLAAGDLVVIEPLPELAAGDSIALIAE